MTKAQAQTQAIRTPWFEQAFSYGSALDIGRLRESNQDQLICLPEQGFFAVSDGMG